MKRLTIAAASLVLLAACSNNPTRSDEGVTGDPQGSMTLKVGPEVEGILNASSASEIASLVAAAWAEQQGWDLYKEAEEAAAFIMAQNPELVEITQSRLSPVTTAAGKPIPSNVEYPEFGPLLQEVLANKGLDFKLFELGITVERYVPMAVEGEDDVDMKLTVTEVFLSHVAWQP